jgi:TRAP-type mannitol/chloroaromatic compound transport system permease small subunit
MRYLFNDPTIWSHEMGLYVFGAIITLGAAYTLLHKGHVTMDVVYIKLSPKARATMDVATFIFFFLFVVVLLWKGWDMTWKAIRIMERSQSVWAPVIWPSRLVIPVGAFLLLLQGLSKFIRDMAVATGRAKP